jgi:alpha-methylacyl-CoA racemase
MLAAVMAARRTGKGQVVDAAMCDGVISLMTAIHEQVAAGEWTEARESNLFDGGLPHYRIYECADGKHLSIGPLEEPFYQRLCGALGLVPPPPRDDPAQWPSLRATFEAVFKTRSRDDWAALLELGDHCLSPVLKISEAPRHAHLAERGSFIRMDGVTQSAPAPRFSRDAAQARSGAREAVPIARAVTALAT